MNDNASSRPAARAATAQRRLAVAAIAAFAGLLLTIAVLALTPDPTGGELEAVVTGLGIAVAVALGSVVGRPAARG